MPDRNDAEGNRPVARVLPDRGIPVFHELVAVVLKLLAEIVEHRPRLMTGRTAQPILPGKGWKSVCILPAAKDQPNQNQRRHQEMFCRWCRPTKAKVHPHTHADSLQFLLLRQSA